MAFFSVRKTFSRPKRPRLGFAENLLTRPLVRGIELVGGRADIQDYPDDHVPKALAEGDLDIALVSSIELISHPEYLIIPTICVGTFGGGGVAVLCSKVLPTEIQTILLDSNGRTFGPLLDILLPRQVMIRPHLMPSDAVMEESAHNFHNDPGQAFLLTGLAALKATYQDFFWTWDVMQAWKKYTNLPFVLWVWAVRPNVDLLGLDGELNSVLVGNLSRFDELIADESKRTGLDSELIRMLYAEVLHYTLDTPYVAGLRRFAKEAVDAGLMPGKAPLRMYSSR